jgi:hypothetical protein
MKKVGIVYVDFGGVLNHFPTVRLQQNYFTGIATLYVLQ